VLSIMPARRARPAQAGLARSSAAAVQRGYADVQKTLEHYSVLDPERAQAAAQLVKRGLDGITASLHGMFARDADRLLQLRSKDHDHVLTRGEKAVFGGRTRKASSKRKHADAEADAPDDEADAEAQAAAAMDAAVQAARAAANPQLKPAASRAKKQRTRSVAQELAVDHARMAAQRDDVRPLQRVLMRACEGAPELVEALKEAPRGKCSLTLMVKMQHAFTALARPGAGGADLVERLRRGAVAPFEAEAVVRFVRDKRMREWTPAAWTTLLESLAPRGA
jgi:hypothetical protein